MGAISTARFGSEFESFLYAAVWQDNDGMPLTVLSALARQDVDPWEEAAKLARLPEARAAAQLALLLGALRNATLASSPDLLHLAAPLVALLPRRLHAPIVPGILARVDPIKHPGAISNLVFVLTYLIFMLLSTWMIGSLQASKPVQSAPISTAVDSSRPPPTSDAP